MKATHIVRSLVGAFVNSPPSRLKEMPLSAFSGMTTKSLMALRDKMAVMMQVIDNNLLIRQNAAMQARGVIDDKTREIVLQEIDKGRLLK